MRLGKEICNLQGRMNKRQSNGVMLEMMTNKMTIDLNVLSSLIKTELWAIWKELWLSQYIGVRWEKKTLISASNQRNQTISLVVDAMTEAEGKSKYQILQKRKTKYHSIFFFFAETDRKYQITETEKKKKYQNYCRDRTEIPNCRSWRKVEIPDFAEAEDKISLQFLFFFGRNLTQIPNCRNWREDEIPKQFQRHNRNTKLQKLKRRRDTKTIAETKHKYQIAEQKYQIAEIEEKMKYQNNCRDRQKYQIAEADGQSKY